MAYYKCGRVYTTQNSNVVVDNASGAIANFNTPLSLPLIETKFGVKATQDLNGQSGPYPAGGSAQIWDEELESGYIDNDTGGNTSSYQNRARSKNYIPTTPQTAYYFVSKNNVSVQVLGYDENKNYIGIVKSMATSQSFTTLENCYFIRFKTTVDYALPYKNDFSINYPSTDTDYHPYSNICPIDGWDEITLKCAKKNFVDNSHISDENYWELVAYDTFIFPLDLPKNATLTISGQHTFPAGQAPYVYLYEKQPDGTWKSILNFWQNQQNLLPYSFTTKNTEYRLWAYNAVVSINTIDWLQIEAGTDASDYEEYSEPVTEVINLGGTYYGGYVTQDKNGKRELVVTHNVKLFSELTFGRSNNSGIWEGYRFYALVDKLRGKDVKCSHYEDFSVISASSVMNNETLIAPIGNDYIYVRDDNYTTVEAFKTANANTQLWYELAEPFTVALPDGEPIKSFPGINNIFCDTGDTAVKFRKIG